MQAKIRLRSLTQKTVVPSLPSHCCGAARCPPSLPAAGGLLCQSCLLLLLDLAGWSESLGLENLCSNHLCCVSVSPCRGNIYTPW